MKRTQLKRRAPLRARRRDTGPSRKVRALVLARDGWSCVACGKDVSNGQPYSLQHRKARGQGGSNEPSNLIMLCGSAVTGCHGKCEARDREMQARGYWLESWQDPATEPVTVWLDATGGYVLGEAA